MHRAMINCNQVQTEVISEGRWIEEDPLPNSSKDVVLVIPGNPGVPRFYESFIKTLHLRLTSADTPVWIIGHAGHVQPAQNLDIAMPNNQKWAECYSLAAQVQHKAEFIKRYIPEDAHLHLIGHSIGSWVAINLLKDKDISRRIRRCYLLFPTIEYMAESPNGIFFTSFFLHVAPVLVFLSWIFTSMFPVTVQTFMIRTFGILFGIPGRCVGAVRQMLDPRALRRIMNLAKDEMNQVKEADHETISKHTDKLWMYYGASDGWVPVKYYKNIMSRHPDLNAQLCQRGFQHSFVLKDDVDVGNLVGDLINEDLGQ